MQQQQVVCWCGMSGCSCHSVRDAHGVDEVAKTSYLAERGGPTRYCWVRQKNIRIPHSALTAFDTCFAPFFSYNNFYTCLHTCSRHFVQIKNATTSAKCVECLKSQKRFLHRNSAVGDIQKYFFRATLEGIASQIIKSFEFSDSNYDTASKRLHKRFANKHRLIQNHLDEII